MASASRLRPKDWLSPGRARLPGWCQSHHSLGTGGLAMEDGGCLLTFSPSGLPIGESQDCRRWLPCGDICGDRLRATVLMRLPWPRCLSSIQRKLVEIYLPPAEIHALQRLTRQRKRMESAISGRKIRISAIVDGYLPGVRRAFSDAWSLPVRAFLRSQLNPYAVVREGEGSLHAYLSKACPRSRWSRAETHLVFLACHSVADVCELSRSAGTLNEDFFVDLQDEIARE
jgi:hypothetical protein